MWLVGAKTKGPFYEETVNLNRPPRHVADCILPSWKQVSSQNQMHSLFFSQVQTGRILKELVTESASQIHLNQWAVCCLP